MDVELNHCATDECTCGAHDETEHGYTGDRAAYIARMRRIEGQVRGIERMIEQNTYCIDVLTQISAATKALQSVSLALLEDHLNHCVVGAARADDDAGREKVREATQAVARLWKS
ncbi:DNA-binding transcriptional regulator, FrmR family [Ruaniaceae bacterium KH17]|nr:DNA-binding transcriptional regulator, FrmR family [Ruaniaceae bacterium KH17]